VKTKTLITSILLGVIATILAGYLMVGCSSRQRGVSRTKDEQSERVIDNTLKARDAFLKQIIEEEREKDISALSKTKDSKIPYANELTYPRGWREVPETPPGGPADREKIDSRIVNTTTPIPGDQLRIAGEMSQEKSDADVISHLTDNLRGGRGGRDYSLPSSMPLTGKESSIRFNQQPVQKLASSRLGVRSRPSGPTTLSIDSELATVTADEIWIIAKAETGRIVADEDTPGSGAMLAKLPDEEKEIPLPLKHTDVKGQISGYIATVEVTQQFHNPYDEKIEAIYVFPLPQNAAVNEFIMIIGERKIRGIIRERQEAERIYAEARRQGYTASLLTQERPNIFTQKVANIEPKKQIDVNIKYFNTLAYVDGWYEFVFPMVVGPRFNPPGSTDGIGAVAHGKTGISGQKTEVQYLKPGERSGHDISLAVDIDAGVAIEEISCPSHVITNSSVTAEKRTVKLSSLDSIPNKDFVLRYKVAGKTVKSALVTHQDQRGGFFTLMLYPPDNLKHLKRAPMEMIFVLDCSGSMRGKPIAKAKDAITRALKQLQPGDTFQVIRFSNNASQLGPIPVPATPENIRKGLRYIESLDGSGGTMMIEGIRAALDFPHDPERFRLVSFMTDGYIGNESQILAEVHNRLGDSRIFSFGVGSNVNRYLLDRMAKLGRGAVAYIGLDESAGEIIDLFYERISHPALTDVSIDWGNLKVTDVYPAKVPDLFVGRPIILTGRFESRGDTTIRINGKVGNLDQEIAIAVNLGESGNTHGGIACVWARKKIETLASRATYDGSSELPEQIKQVALEYGLMSAYTAFIAVDSSRQTAGDHGVTVAVPVPVPYGVQYETTVQE
jgi:Ca-activated chloride channel family protein